MSEDDKNNLDSYRDKVNEPQAEYSKKEIHFFNSPEEMNEHQYRHWLSLTPEQRLAEHYELITRFYNYKENNSPYDKIYFPE